MNGIQNFVAGEKNIKIRAAINYAGEQGYTHFDAYPGAPKKNHIYSMIPWVAYSFSTKY